jgi:thioredoxin 2
LVLRGGEVLARQPGAAPGNVLRDWLDQALTSSQGSSQEVRT